MPDSRRNPGGEGVASPPLEVHSLGVVPYARGVELQEELVRERREGRIPDQLLLLEHPSVITLGRGSAAGNVLLDEAERMRRGVELHESGRGGDVTFHGPGQLVGYPILALEPDRRDLHRYLRDLEEVLIRALSTLGVTGERAAGLTGVWVGGEKIAAIGVRVSSGWITSHGFALNIRTDLTGFEAIVPCGIRDRGVTSLERVLGPEAPLPEGEEWIITPFCEVFGRSPVTPSEAPQGRG
jgi:lipoyl(octanoyl) transferase